MHKMAGAFLGETCNPLSRLEGNILSFFSWSRMLSKLTLLGLLVMSRGMSCVGHDDHDHEDQMPLDYVRYPYQAAYYPGDDSGPCFLSLLSLRSDVQTVSPPPDFLL